MHKYTSRERHASVTWHATRERHRSLLERHITRDASFTRSESTVWRQHVMIYWGLLNLPRVDPANVCGWRVLGQTNFASIKGTGSGPYFLLLTWLSKEIGNFVSISSLTGKCAAQKLKKKIAVLVHGHVYIIIVILISQNKITDFFMILAWASPFKHTFIIPKCKRAKNRLLNISSWQLKILSCQINIWSCQLDIYSSYSIYRVHNLI